MTAARVGIVLPVFNTDPGFLREAVDSALAQSVPVDVVMVDDCSTDEATVAALSRARLNTPARLLRHEVNQGPGVALNTGITAVEVPYIFAMGSDDRVEPTYAELAPRVLDERPEVSIVTTDIQRFGAAQGTTRRGAPRG